jgi:hypothetical protein
LDLALGAVGGVDSVLGSELHRLAKNFDAAQTTEGLYAPAIILRDYLRDVL